MHFAAAEHLGTLKHTTRHTFLNHDVNTLQVAGKKLEVQKHKVQPSVLPSDLICVRTQTTSNV